MTAETDVHSEVSGVSKVEFEEKCGLDMSSRDDLPRVGGDCNGVSHCDDEEGINGNGKDDTDCSYVFVSGSDAVSDDPVEKDLNVDCIEELDVPESNVHVGELSVDNGENVQSCVEDGCIVEGAVVSPSNNDVAREGGIVEGAVVSPSNNDVAPEGKLDEGEVGRSDTIEEQNGTVAVESEPQPLDSEVMVEERIKVESSAELEENEESQIMVSEAAECESLHLDDGKVKAEEQNDLGSTEEVEDSQESQITITKSAESEPHQLDNGEDEVEESHELDSETDIKESPESQITATQDVQFYLDLEKEEAELAHEIPAEGLPGDLEMELELNLKGATCQVASTQLETEIANGPVSDDSLPTCHVEDCVSEIKAINDFNDGSQNTPELELNLKAATCHVANTQLETEVANGPLSDDSLPTCHVEDSVSKTKGINDFDDGSQNTPELNGSSENAESLSIPAECMRSEIEVENVPVDNVGESLPMGPDNETIIEPEVGNDAFLITENFPACAVDDGTRKTEVEKFDVESSEGVDDTKSEIEVENGLIGGDSTSNCPANDVRSEIEIRFGSINCKEEVHTFPWDDVQVESGISDGVTECACSQPIPVNDLDIESHVTDSVENGSSLPTCPGADVKSESEVENASSISLLSRDLPSEEAAVSESKVLNDSVVNSESVLNCVPDVVDVENEDQFTSGDDDKPVCQETEGFEGIHRDETSTSSQEGPSADALDGQNVGAEVGKRPFYFLIRIPRYDDDGKIREQIRIAQLQVEEKTQNRDAIRVQIQTKRATCKEYGDNFEAAKSEERAARELVKSKRQEIDSVQSVINRVKNAISIEDIDVRIHNMEHMIEHETLPLKEEKQLIREIKQLKQHREQLSFNMGRQDELQQALDQRDQTEERLKLLKKELDILKDKVLRAEGITKAARKKYFDENEKLYELQAQFRAADDLRQEAYADLQSLRKQLSEKNKYFRMYKDNEKAAIDNAIAGKREALQHLCVNQVETIMELWNKNEEFRKEYIRCNTRSTLRRLRTLDGRSLGPDEEPPVLPNFVDGRVDKSNFTPTKVNSVSLIPTLEQEKQVLPMEAEKADDESMAKVVEQKNQTVTAKKTAKPTPLGNGSAAVSVRDETEEAKEEENKKTKVEVELTRKAEELRKEEEAAKLKEQLRLEEKTKAKEAQERKKRNAEKAQARAELRAQKEAEQKEKEREKRARKKQRKKAAGAEATNGSSEGESAPISEVSSESTKESEKERPMAITKRPQKSSHLTKQTKTKSIPLPLRNRGKRRMQPWMWVLLAALLVLALFLVGNSGFSFNFGLRSFGF